MRKSIIFFFGFFLGLVSVSPVCAWGREGHETTGAIADLTPLGNQIIPDLADR